MERKRRRRRKRRRKQKRRERDRRRNQRRSRRRRKSVKRRRMMRRRRRRRRLNLGLRHGDHHPHVSRLQDGVGLVAIIGIGGVGGDVSDTIGIDPGVTSTHYTVLVLGFEAVLVVAQLVVSHGQAELVGVGGVDDFLLPEKLLRGAKGNTHKAQ